MKPEITAAEAWEVVERLKLDVTQDATKGGWYATKYLPKVELGYGVTPIDAVASLLYRIGQTPATTEVASV